MSQSVARGFTGSQVFNTIGTVRSVDGDPNPPEFDAGYWQYIDCDATGTLNARVATNDPAYPAPKIILYKVGSGLSGDLFADLSVLTATVTGANGVALIQGAVSQGERIFVVIGDVPANFRGIQRHWINPLPKAAPPSILRTRYSYQPSAGKLYMSAYYGYQNLLLWYRTSPTGEWTRYTKPVTLGAIQVSAIATAVGYEESNIISALI